MVTRLVRHGDELALVIDRPTLEQLGIDEMTPLEVTSAGEGLFVSPVKDGRARQTFEQALDDTNRKYGPMLRRLAE